MDSYCWNEHVEFVWIVGFRSAHYALWGRFVGLGSDGDHRDAFRVTIGRGIIFKSRCPWWTWKLADCLTGYRYHVNLRSLLLVLVIGYRNLNGSITISIDGISLFTLGFEIRCGRVFTLGR